MLIIDGNAVYEVDTDCMRQRHLDMKRVYGDHIRENGPTKQDDLKMEKIVRRERYTGKGVTVAVLDTGIYPHADFGKRILAFQDFVYGKKYPYDKNGHGTHAPYPFLNWVFTFKTICDILKVLSKNGFCVMFW